MSRQNNNKRDNTPFWAVDPDQWDLSYKSFHGKDGEVTFDVSREATVRGDEALNRSLRFFFRS